MFLTQFPRFSQLPGTLARYITTTSSLSPPTALQLLKSQPAHYVIAQLHLRKYLLTPNDILTVPRINELKVGETIQLSRILEVGSRDYTLRPAILPKDAVEGDKAIGGRTLDSNQVKVWATVIEHTKSELQTIEKFKKRKRYSRRLIHKGKWSVLFTAMTGQHCLSDCA